MHEHEQIKYINHFGEIIEFGKGDYFVNANDLRDYSWGYDSDNNVIANFTRDSKTKTIPVVICGKDNTTLKNRLFEIFEADVLAAQKGAFWAGDYYYRCYVVQSKKSDYINALNSITVNISTVTDEPYWVKEIKTQFRTSADGVDGLKYPKTYNYRYTDYNTSCAISNNTIAATPFKLIIYGAAENPEIFIGRQKYKINVTLAANEYLTLTAFDEQKTIFITQSDGTQVNCFNSREKSINVFEPIPTGTFEVSWDGSFVFDLIICDRRSEPPCI